MRAATGIRTKVCRAFQNKSKAGILSANSSIAKSTLEAAITHQLESRCSPEGKSSSPAWVRSPRVATVAYTLRPAAKLTATIRPTSSEPPNFMPASISGLRFLHTPKKEKGRLRRPSLQNQFENPLPCAYRVDSISKPQASSKGSGMYLEFLFRRAHSRFLLKHKYCSENYTLSLPAALHLDSLDRLLPAVRQHV